MITVFPALGVGPALAQNVDRVIIRPDSAHVLSRPVQLAVSRDGGSIGVADKNGNRIIVLDVDGNEVWSAGDAVRINQPSAVGFDAMGAVLFTEEKKLVVFKVAKDALTRIDTVADLTAVLPDARSIDQIIPTGNLYLLLDRSKATVYRCKADWTLDKVLLKHGQGKGKLWSPSSIAVDLSKNIIIADEANLPIQTVSPDGNFLFRGSWNSPQQEPNWECSAVCVTSTETVWAADVTNSTWRLYDRSGSEVSRIPFNPAILRPVSMIALPNNRAFVADANGTIVIIRLT